MVNECNPKLMLKYQLAADSQFHVKRALRIKLDGQGSLFLYESKDSGPQMINLAEVRTFSIDTVIGAAW